MDNAYEFLESYGDFGFENFQAKQLARFPASHHTSPLVYYPQRHVVELLNGTAQVDPTDLLKKICDAANRIDAKVGGSCFLTEDPTRVYSYFLTEACLDGEDDQIYLKEKDTIDLCLQTSLREVRQDLNAINSSHPGANINSDALQPSMQELNEKSRVLSRSLSCRQLLELIRNTIQQNHIVQKEDVCPIPSRSPFDVFIFKEMIFFKEKSSTTIIIINYDQLLMLFDTISCRFMTRVALTIAEWSNSENLPPWAVLKAIYTWGDNLIISYGMNAYAYLGEFESIVTAVLVTFPGSDILNLGNRFMESLIESAAELESDYRIPSIELEKILRILKSISSVNWLSEIFGIRKHWGNPMVSAEESGKAVQEKVLEELPVKGSALIRLLASFNRMIVMSYLKTNGRWPKGCFPEGTPDTPIKRAHAKGLTRVLETSHEHRHEHWAYFKFESNCVIDSYKNDLSLISDKSVSYYKPHLDAVYVRKLCKVKVPTASEDRRLILEYIRKQHMPIMDIFKVVMCGAVPDDWLANTASMKGTEMKYLKARIFAVLTYELRQYFAATEDIIKQHIFPYNPHQTMTMGETELLARLKDVTRQLDPNSGSRTLAVMHIVDFSKWNLRMRYSNTCLVFKAIDDFLGTPGLIESTHRLFSCMTNIVNDPFNPPEDGVAETSSATIWRNHNCGWEGQRQKGWTALTSAVLSDLERTSGIKSIICGQGDNQTLLTQFPVPNNYQNPLEWIHDKPEDVRQLLDDYYQRLGDECEAIGLKIKTAETCRSLCYFNYGKRLYFNGVELSMTLKRISKNITEPNDSYPTSEDVLKTLEGSAFAAGLFSHPSILPYIVSRFATALQLTSLFSNNQLVRDFGDKALQKRGLTMNGIILSTLLKIPPSLGGPPQQNLAAYLYRGHPDPLCVDLVMLSLRAKNGCPTSKNILACAASGRWFNQDPTRRESLIHSPYSLNLNTPTSCRVPLEKAIMPALRAKCRNRLVREMFTASMDIMEAELIKNLSTLQPCQPLVANDIYSRTLPGRRKTFIAGLANTTSLGRLLQDDTSHPMIKKIQLLEEAQLDIWVERVFDVRKSNSTLFNVKPHHEFAQYLRDKSWGTVVVGVTVPHPLDQFSLTEVGHDMCSSDCQTCLKEHIVIVRHSEDLVSLPGSDKTHLTSARSRQGSPYLGSTISEGIIQKQILCTNPDETWRDVIRLNTIRRWVADKGTALDLFLERIIKSRTDVGMSIVDGATGIPSRLSYNHRANLMSVINSCSISTTSNMHTRLYISSNRMGEYSHGEVNYHMPFGPAFLCFQSLLCLQGVYSPDRWRQARQTFHLHVRSDNVPVVYDGSLDVADNGENLQMSRVNIPPILFSRYETLIFDTPSGYQTDSIWSDFETASIEKARQGYATQLIGSAFVRETIVRESITHNRLEGFTHRGVPITIGDVRLVGVKSFVRTLAWNSLLLTSSQIWSSDNEQSFLVRANLFLRSFSRSFWDTFLGPFMNQKLAIILTKAYPGVSTHNATKTMAGMAPILRHAIAHEMWEIFENLSIRIRRPRSVSKMAIFAPSLSSLKLMLSKYLELVIHISLGRHKGSKFKAHSYSRDFSFNIQSVDYDKLRAAFPVIASNFVDLMRANNVEGEFLPAIELYSSQHPWVDRLRGEPAEPVNLSLSPDLQRPENFDTRLDSVTFSIHENSVMVRIGDCDCPRLERKQSLHEECYFASSGILSKSHLKFLDIIFSLQLNVTGVICTGSSTGTEAQAIATLSDCYSVYVNCLSMISEYSPHAAGSYIPSAFLNKQGLEKLCRSSSAVVSESDLTQDSTIDAIHSHTEEVIMTGITCDAELPRTSGIDVYMTILRQLIRLAVRKPRVDWIIMKVPFGCAHDLVVMSSIMARCFKNTHVISSWFSRPGVNLVYLVGTSRRVAIVDGFSEQTVPAVLLTESPFDPIIKRVSTECHSRLFFQDKAMVSSKMCLWQYSSPSAKAAFNSFIPGWCPPANGSKDAILKSIFYVREDLLSYIKSILIMSNTAHSDRHMPRSAILQLDPAALNKVLNNIYFIVAKCDLLSKLLEPKVFIVDFTRRTILHWLATMQQYYMRNRYFFVTKNATKFVNSDSRHLYEILGNVYRMRYEQPDEDTALINIHLANIESYPERRQTTFESLQTQRKVPAIDLRWRWERRAEILFWLMAREMIGHELLVKTRIGFALQELHSMDAASDIVEFRVGTPPGVLIQYTDSLVDVVALLAANNYIVVCVPIHLFGCLRSMMKIDLVRRCPWTGVLPSRVVVSGQRGQSYELLSYPDFGPTINSIYEIGKDFIGCGCYDCSLERHLVVTFKVRHSELDRLCSLGTVETVRDTKHRL